MMYKKELQRYAYKRSIYNIIDKLCKQLNDETLQLEDIKLVNSRDKLLTIGVLYAKGKASQNLHNSSLSIALYMYIKHVSHWRLTIYQIIIITSHHKRLNVLLNLRIN